VAVIDESAAKRYWPGEDPIGKRFKGQDPRGHNDDWLTVIGVVRDMRRNGLEREPLPHVFEWYRQEPASTPPDLVVRTTGEPRMLSPMLRAAIRVVDPGVILSPVTTLDEQLADQLAPRRFQTSLLGLFSVIALLLATVGVFALMHFAVAQRTHEIGVRIALGAQRRSVMGMVLGEGLRLALAGIAIGVLAALALTRFLSTLLFGVGATDPTTFGGVALLLMTAALAGCYLPARHATSIDPMIALRYE
jgi:putative ABC transport system permease protein